MQLRSSRGFNILELLEPDPSEEQSRKTSERALFPELREAPLLIFPVPLLLAGRRLPCYACVCVTSPTEKRGLVGTLC